MKKTTPKTTDPKDKASSPRKTAKVPVQAKKDAPGIAATKSVAATASSVPASLAAPPTPDPRLPASGTVLQKKDRHGAVRCECTVEEGVTDDNRSKVVAAISKHAQVIESLREKLP